MDSLSTSLRAIEIKNENETVNDETSQLLNSNNENSVQPDFVQQKSDCDKMKSGLNTNTSSSYLPWNDFFMSMCYLTAARSKDPNRKVGACIVSQDNRVVSLGYNGMPRGISDKDLPWEREADNINDTKYPYVCHAELNAILNEKHCPLEGCRMYTTLFPCSECAKAIIQSGIKEVIYAESQTGPDIREVPSRKMFSLAKIDCRKFIPTVHHLNLNIVDGLGKISIS